MLHNTPEGLKKVLEALLLSSSEPLTLNQLRAALGEDWSLNVLRSSLEELHQDWQPRGLALVAVADGWRFQTQPCMQTYLDRIHAEKPPRYSRAVMETLAVIVYKQPVTRGDIESMRGVAVNAGILRTLLERDWIKAAGHRNVPGRPELFITTRRFLSDLGVRSLDELPPLQDEQGWVLPKPSTSMFDFVASKADETAVATGNAL